MKLTINLTNPKDKGREDARKTHGGVYQRWMKPIQLLSPEQTVITTFEVLRKWRPDVLDGENL